ncbi:efflux RND transporter periplasmic adaptor subunit [Desulfonatronum sp. SC1]|uniref:efflux RND transporter periplasmic adaptor subunit n=1 Tax=Desulfonatronum sp. SC1 TaxID=2109626 RepID=UPI001E4F5D4D|nr:efflux RND transporter periplasmic adaptor subunit [Desulfonatronum sp. SC1]
MIVLITLVGGLMLTAALWGGRPTVPDERMEAKMPFVRVVTVQARQIILHVHSQGTVQSHAETALAAELSGVVSHVAPRFHAGGFFRAGEVMLEIEASEYSTRLARAKAEAAAADMALAEEYALAEQADHDWLEFGNSPASPLALREPQLRSAKARVLAANAEVTEAARLLEKTRVRAPYPAMVRRTAVALGQYVAPGGLLADIFSVEKAEVRLPVEERDLAFLDFDALSMKGKLEAPVRLHGRIAGRQVEWQGRIVRSEGVFDTQTHMVVLVAEINDPYALEGRLGQPSLPMGLFVEAEIAGRTVDGVVALPAHALRSGTLWVVDDEDRLRPKSVRLLRLDAKWAWIDEGLAPGDRVCLTALQYAVEGMRVRPEPFEEVATSTENRISEDL